MTEPRVDRALIERLPTDTAIAWRLAPNNHGMPPWTMTHRLADKADPDRPKTWRRTTCGIRIPSVGETFNLEVGSRRVLAGDHCLRCWPELYK